MRFFVLSLFSIFLSFSSYAADWTGFTDCGDYLVNGIARSDKNGIVIVVNEKTQSQISITVPISHEPILAPYLNKELKATLHFEKKSPGTKLSGTIIAIDSRNPNPLNPKDTGISLINKANCK